jgi:hypothetical protein
VSVYDRWHKSQLEPGGALDAHGEQAPILAQLSENRFAFAEFLPGQLEQA